MKKWTINSSHLVSSWACKAPRTINVLGATHQPFNFLFPAHLWSKLYSYITGKTTLNLGIRNMRWRNGPSTPVIWSTHERASLHTSSIIWTEWEYWTFSFLPIFEANYTRTCIHFLRAKQLLNLGIRNIRWRNGPSTPVIWSAQERVRLPTPLTFWAQRISHSTFAFLPIFETSYTRTLRAKQLYT